MMKITIGSYTIAMKYLFKRSNRNTYYYKRRVPADLKPHYDKPFIEISLGQTDKSLAAVVCEDKHQFIENQFTRLRNGLPKEQVLSNYQSAITLLAGFDLSRKDTLKTDEGTEAAKNNFFDELDHAINLNAPSDVYEAYRDNKIPFPKHLLNEEQRSALAIIQGKFRLTASQYPEEYLRLTGRSGNRRNVNEANNVITSLISCCGDRPPAEYLRSDINEYIQFSRKTKRTATIQRQLKAIAAMFTHVSLEMDLKVDQKHSFVKLNIPNLGDDSQDREDFNAEQLQKIRQMPTSKTPEITHMIHLMLDTGMRVKECCGLMVTDIHLDAETPYLKLYKNNVRDLKTKSSKRLVPLVGLSLSAMQAAIANTSNEYIFPRYVSEKDKLVKNDTASAACNKRLTTLLGKGAPTSHSFRHTMQTRLRNVECPKDVRDELGGWAKDISDNYGSPADLKLKAKYMTAALKAL